MCTWAPRQREKHTGQKDGTVKGGGLLMIPQKGGHKKHINAKYEGKQLKGEKHDK